jgi:hypothetical protein
MPFDGHAGTAIPNPRGCRKEINNPLSLCHVYVKAAVATGVGFVIYDCAIKHKNFMVIIRVNHYTRRMMTYSKHIIIKGH